MGNADTFSPLSTFIIAVLCLLLGSVMVYNLLTPHYPQNSLNASLEESVDSSVSERNCHVNGTWQTARDNGTWICDNLK